MARKPDKPDAEPGAKPAAKPAAATKARAAAAGSRKRAPASSAKQGKATAKRAAAPPPPVAPGADIPLKLPVIVAAVIIALDQFSKWLVVHQLSLATRYEIDFINPWLNFRMAWNQGVNFGLLSSSVEVMRWVLIAVALIVCVWIGIWVQRSRPGRFARIAAGLLIGGAIGNVIDRLVYGAVADFLNMSLPGWANPYSFNIADIAIFIGAIGLVFQPQPDKLRDDTDKTG